MARELSGIGRARTRLRWLAAVAVAATLVIVAPTATFAATIPTFTIDGTGFGHGVGMSQLGAVQAAKKGLTAEQIMKHYFRDVSLTLEPTYEVAVNLMSNASTANKGAVSWTLRPGYYGTQLIVNNIYYGDVAGGYTFVGSKDASGSLLVTMTYKDGATTRSVPLGEVAYVKPAGQAQNQPGLIQVANTSGAGSLTNTRYRGRLMRLAPITGESYELKLLNYVDIEDYLCGVVPRELGNYFTVDSSGKWWSAASEAQAIAARSYGYPARQKELFCSTLSQAYGGHSRFASESARTAGTAVAHEEANANTAISRTRGLHISYAGAVVATYFAASNGPVTANNEDIWGTTPIKYARSIVDPYFVATSSTKWTFSPTGLELAKQIGRSFGPAGAGTSIWVEDVKLTYGAGGYAKIAVVSWSNGSISTIEDGASIYKAFGEYAKSPQFTIKSSLPTTKYEEAHAGIALVGPWPRAPITGSSGGAIVTTKTKGAYFSAKFTGEGIKWIGPKASSYGRALVYIDGALKSTLNLYSSTTARQQQLYSITGLDPSKQHEIKVVVTTKSGSSLTGYVGLDRLDVLGGTLIVPPITAFEESSPIVRRSTGWSTFTSGSMLGGAAIYTNTLNRSVYATFKGNEVRLYGYTAASGGRAKLYLDGVYIKTINYRTSTTVTKKLLFYKGSLDPTKTHTIKLVTIPRVGSTRAGRVSFDRVSVTGYSR